MPHATICWSMLLLLALARQAAAQPAPPIRLFSPFDHGGQRQTWSIAQAADGTMAFANDAGLLLFDGVRWQLLPAPGGHTLRSVYCDSARSQWLAGAYHALYRWPIQPLYAAKPAADTIHIASPTKEEWWHASQHPLARDQVYWQTFSQLALYTGADTLERVEVPGNIMFHRVLDRRLLLPVISQGLYVQSETGWQLLADHPPLRDGIIVGLASQTSGDILVATREAGLWQLAQQEIHPWPASNVAWAGADLTALLPLHDGGYALATGADGIYLLDSAGAVRAHINRNNSAIDGTPTALFEDAAGDLWVGFDGGIAHIDLSSQLLLYQRQLGAVYDIEELKGELLVATNEGLKSLAFTGKVTPLAASSGQVWHITSTPGGIVVGNNDGTFVLDTTTSTYTLKALGQLAGGWSWLTLNSSYALAGTYVGLELFARSTSTWESRGSLDGYGGPVEQIRMDEHGELTVVHPQEGEAIFSLDVAARQVVQRSPFRPRIGTNGSLNLPGDLLLKFSDRHLVAASPTHTHTYSLRTNTARPSALRLADGRLAVGLTDGLALLPPLTQPVESKAPASAFAKTNQRRTTVYLNQARFDQAPLWRVKLSVDSAYSPWSEQATYRYPLLATGEYAFQWENDDGQQGELTWTIAPRWYETGWAKVLYLFLAVLMLVGIRHYYRQRLDRQQRLADVERERQLQAERLRTRAANLEAEVEKSQREASLAAAELAHRNRELARSTMALAKQNDALLQVKQALEPLPKSGEIGKARRQLSHLVEAQLGSEEDWAFFQEHFDLVHAGFLTRLRQDFPELTSGDQRLAALLRMNLPSKEIAPLLHISVRGVENKRYRLRKKLGLHSDTNLTEWILSY